MPPERGRSRAADDDKLHPLENLDRLVPDLYHYITQSSPQTGEGCSGFLLPDTIVYRGGKPLHWFYCEQPDGPLGSRDGDLRNETVFEEFTKPAYYQKKSDIIAVYICVEATHKGEDSTIEYLNKSGLYFFLFYRKKTTGRAILQRFVDPNMNNSSVMRATWSQGVCMIERKVNVNPLNDSRLDMFERAATFEAGDSDFVELSVEKNVANSVSTRIQQICAAIVAHIRTIPSSYYRISRLVLHFRLGSRKKIWLLYCSSLRLGPKRLAQKSSKMDPVSFEDLRLLISRPAREYKYGLAETSKPKDTGEKVAEKSFFCPSCQKTVSIARRFDVTFEELLYYYTEEQNEIKHRFVLQKDALVVGEAFEKIRDHRVKRGISPNGRSPHRVNSSVAHSSSSVGSDAYSVLRESTPKKTKKKRRPHSAKPLRKRKSASRGRSPARASPARASPARRSPARSTSPARPVSASPRGRGRSPVSLTAAGYVERYEASHDGGRNYIDTTDTKRIARVMKENDPFYKLEDPQPPVEIQLEPVMWDETDPIPDEMLPEVPQAIKTFRPDMTKKMLMQCRSDPMFRYQKMSVCWSCFMQYTETTKTKMNKQHKDHVQSKKAKEKEKQLEGSRVWKSAPSIGTVQESKEWEPPIIRGHWDNSFRKPTDGPLRHPAVNITKKFNAAGHKKRDGGIARTTEAMRQRQETKYVNHELEKLMCPVYARTYSLEELRRAQEPAAPPAKKKTPKKKTSRPATAGVTPKAGGAKFSKHQRDWFATNRVSLNF